MKHIEAFDAFLSKHVELGKDQRNLLNERVKSLYEFLSRSLDSFEMHERQGSYGLDTIIRPVNNRGYDVDILLFMKLDEAKDAMAYIDEVYDALREDMDYASSLERKTRSVVVGFNQDFHVDVLPCITLDGKPHICDYKENRLVPTDGTGYREWFKQKTDVTNGHLKAATRLLKYIRDHKGNFEVPSVILTTLVGHSVNLNERGKRFNDVPETLKIVSNRINSSLQATPNRPRLRNPAMRSERFTRHWDRPQYANFREKFNIYNDRINDAFNEIDESKSLAKWQVLFGTAFK